MADEQLVALFARSDAPEADPEFVSRVSRAIARERRKQRLLEFGTACATAAALFVMAPLLGDLAAQVAKSLPGLMNQSLIFLAAAAAAAGWGLSRAYA